MVLTMRERKSVSREFALKYQSVSKKVKSKILNEYVKLTNYRRDYAYFLLKNWNRKVYLNNGRVVIIGDFMNKRSKSVRKRKYCDETFNIIYKFWKLLNYPCGKRLKSQLLELLSKAMEFDEIRVNERVSDNLKSISASTIDRLLKSSRDKFILKGRSRTKPGTLLRKNIPIIIGVDWNEDELVYLEIDLVSHEVSNNSVEFCYTLNTVDVKSGWTDMGI